jgi:hypothetical protein
LPTVVTTSDLPSGLSFSASAKSIKGTIRTPGTYQFTVSATNGVGTTMQQVSITVS